MVDAALKTPVIMLHLPYHNSVSIIYSAVRRHYAIGLHREQIAASAIRVMTATKVVVHFLPRIKSKSLADVW